MTERKWTKGKWYYDGLSVSVEGDYEIVADVFGVNQDDRGHLIAAAPDLYEALEDARDTILQLINSRGSEAEGSDLDWVGVIDAALAKARGEK